MNQVYEGLGIRRGVREFVTGTERTLRERFESIDAVAEYNQMEVIRGMQDSRVSDIHFVVTTGYGYNDLGCGTLEDVYASVFHGESVLVRPQLMSDTYVFHVALSGNLHPGDELLSPVGEPYDTLREVIGIRDSVGSFKEYGTSCRQVELPESDSFDYKGIAIVLDEKTKLVAIQCSKGYIARPTSSVRRIGELISFIKNIKPGVVCMVDNCYGGLVEATEPTDVGADVIVDSLIKNPGGGLVPIGGYTVGRKDCIERASYRLSTPGLGKGVGASLGLSQQLYQGLFLSPVVVSGALKDTIFTASIYERLGCIMVPNGSESHHDIIQAITFGAPEGVVSFCRGIQIVTPVGSYVTSEPQDVPGYDSPVTMAAGTFVQGSSVELSTDGPTKPPYAVYLQGGLIWYHAKLGVLKSLQQLSDNGVLRILR